VVAAFRSADYGFGNPSAVVAAPAGVAADDILLAQVHQDTGGTSLSATGAGYALLLGPHGSGQDMWVYWKRAGGSEGSTTWTVSTADDIQVVISAYSGASTTATPAGQQQANVQTDKIHPFPAYTPGMNDALVVAMVGLDGASLETNDFGTWTGGLTEVYDYSAPAFTVQRDMWQGGATLAQTTATVLSATVTSTQAVVGDSVTAVVALPPVGYVPPVISATQYDPAGHKSMRARF